MAVDMKILGPISMTIDGMEINLGDRKQRILLSVLALENRRVEKDRLAQLLWEEDRLPQDPDGQLHGYFSRIRKAIEDVSPGSGRMLKTWRGVGYGLELDAASVDYHRFRRFAAQAKATGERDPETAARLGSAALSEWGSPAGVRGGTPLDAVESQLERIVEGLRQEYQSALMAYLHAELACGRHEQLLPELARLAGYDEYGAENQELARIRMLAIYRAGNKSEALDIYQRIYDVLDEKFSSKPDAETKKLKKQILTDDPALQLREAEHVTPDEPADTAAEAPSTTSEKSSGSSFISNNVYGDKNRFYQAETMTFHERDET